MLLYRSVGLAASGSKGKIVQIFHVGCFRISTLILQESLMQMRWMVYNADVVDGLGNRSPCTFFERLFVHARP
jgi:hypothetical protein